MSSQRRNIEGLTDFNKRIYIFFEDSFLTLGNPINVRTGSMMLNALQKIIYMINNFNIWPIFIVSKVLLSLNKYFIYFILFCCSILLHSILMIHVYEFQRSLSRYLVFKSLCREKELQQKTQYRRFKSFVQIFGSYLQNFPFNY